MDAITLPPPCCRRRRYSPEFKAQVVDACNHPGTSVATIARQHDINDNIVHRWIRESEQAASALTSGVAIPARAESDRVSACTAAPFVPVQVRATSQEHIHLELIKKDLTVRLDWPATLIGRSQNCKSKPHC
jgi:transposase